ncbi:MAG: glutathione peroxidase [Bacteroidetes bacterium]|nr:glutathione peroxidase [Bacteroidota bacterium]
MKTIAPLLILALLALPVQLCSQDSFHDFTVKDIKGSDFPMSQLKGKKVLLVNTASNCGLTPQYKDLEKLYRKYKEKGFVIIGFPSNDFAGQEPGSNSEIAAFCTEKYDVTFLMMEKIVVKGKEIHPLYRWLTQKDENGLEDSKVAWNFQKYMIDEEGALVGHVSPRKKPNCMEIASFIKAE